jgi:hypothetical protein
MSERSAGGGGEDATSGEGSGSGSSSGGSSGSSDASESASGSGSGSDSGSGSSGGTDSASSSGSDSAGDTGTPPADGPDGSLGDCPGNFDLCDGFESGAIDSSVWTLKTGHATAVVDATRPHWGNYSLHVNVAASAGGTYSQAEITETKTFPSTPPFLTGPVFVRAYYWLPSIQDNSTLLAVGAVADGSTGSYSLGIGTPDLGLGFSGPSNQYFASATAMTVQSWTCLELEVYPSSPPNGLIEGWINDNLFTTGTASLPLYNLSVGVIIPLPAASSSIDLFIDDIAVSTVYVGCNQ